MTILPNSVIVDRVHRLRLKSRQILLLTHATTRILVNTGLGWHTVVQKLSILCCVRLLSSRNSAFVN